MGRDYYVRLDTNDYSVDPTAIGRSVDVTADLDQVRVKLAGRLVAHHDRVWARRQTITDPAHLTPRPGCGTPTSNPVDTTPRRSPVT